MIFYVIDVHPKVGELNDQDRLISEYLLLHGDLLRGATTNWMTMKIYYDYMTSLFGKYVDFGTYKYDRYSSYTDEDIPDDVVSSVSLSLYNNDSYMETGNLVATMPYLTRIGLDDNEMYVTTSAMVDLFHRYHISDIENKATLSFIVVFIILARYIPVINKDRDLRTLREYLVSKLPKYLSSQYSDDTELVLNSVYLIKLFVESKSFI